MRHRMKDLAVVLGTAGLTALIATLLLAPEATVAGDENPFADLKMFVADGKKLEVEGLTLTADAGPVVREAGEKPVITLKAVSAAKKTVCLEVEVELASKDRELRYSRALSTVKKLWTEKVEVKVAPGKTREIQLSPHVTTESGTIVSVVLRVGKKVVYAAGYAVKGLSATARAPTARTAGPRQAP